MNVAASPAWAPANAPRRRRAGLPLVLLGGLVTAVAAVVGNGNVIIALAPIFLGAVLWAICVSPIRYTLFGLIFASLALDSSGDGPWDSPLAPLGALLATNLDKGLHLSTSIPVPGAVLVGGLLLLIHVHRSLSGSQIDADRGETPMPLLRTLALSLLAVLALCVWGRMHGGDLQMAKIQVQSFVLLLMVAYLSAISFRGLRDYRIVGGLVVAAGCIKAVNAVYVINTVVPTPEYATSHGDSVLFACAAMILIVRWAEQPIRRHAAWCFLLLPLLSAGMSANARRLVWVQIAAALLLFWVVSRRSLAKRFLANVMLASLPLFVVYVVVGWNSQSRVFAPLKTFRSVEDAQTDSSTQYRDTENYNLLLTMRFAPNPFLGSGFGQPFTEVVKLPDISFFKEYKYMPHNSILGLWAFTGAVGFTGISLAFVCGVYFAALSYSSARTPEERMVAFMVIAAVLIHAVHCWGDIGFSERRSSYLVGPAIAMAGQLAMITGAWRVRSANAAVVRRS